MPTLDERVHRLERELRWWRAGAAAVALIAASTLWVSPAGRELKVGRLSVVDGRGQPQVTLGQLPSGGFGLLLHDEHSRGRALLGLDRDGSPRLSFAAEKGTTLAELTAFRDAAPRFTLAAPDGSTVFQVGLEADGASRMSLSDGTGQPRAILAATESGSPSFQLVDHLGEARAKLSLSEAGAPSLVLADEHGAVFQAPVTGD